MKGRIVFAVLCVLTLVSFSVGQERGFGVGIILGEPTGISAKGWVSSRNAIDAGLAWSFREKAHFHLHADYLWHFPDVIRAPQQFTLFTGIGGRLAAGKGDGIFGVRIVGGVAWLPRNAPFDLFLEVAPIFDLIPATELRANAGIGVRYFFSSSYR